MALNKELDRLALMEYRKARGIDAPHNESNLKRTRSEEP